jgi:hypothetical protein
MCCDWLWVNFGQWKIEEKVIAGCRGYEHVKQRKTLVAQKHMLVTLYTGRIHTWAVVSQGMCTHGVALLTGRVPIDKLIYVEDCCLISVGAENVS